MSSMLVQNKVQRNTVVRVVECAWSILLKASKIKNKIPIKMPSNIHGMQSIWVFCLHVISSYVETWQTNWVFA